MKAWSLTAFFMTMACNDAPLPPAGKGDLYVTLTEPVDGTRFKDNPVIVAGTTNATQLRLRVGDDPYTVTPTQERYSLAVPLQDGANSITVQASKAAASTTVYLESELVVLAPQATAEGTAFVTEDYVEVHGVVRGQRAANAQLSLGERRQSTPIANDGSFGARFDSLTEGNHELIATAQVRGRTLEHRMQLRVLLVRPTITRVEPSAAPTGGVVRLRGVGFGGSPEELQVTVDGVIAEHDLRSDREILFVLPEGTRAGLVDVSVRRLVLSAHPRELTVLLPGSWVAWTDESEARLIPDDGLTTEELAVGDIDHDGDLDVYFVRGGDGPATQNLLLINSDGQGSFVDETTTRMPAHVDSTRDAEFADVDDDGDLDLLVVNTFIEPTLLYLNNGDGVFENATEEKLGPLTDFSCDALLDDFDGDGDLDLLFSSYGDQFQGAPTRLFMSDLRDDGRLNEAWRFRPAVPPFPTDPGVTLTIRAADLDGDGDLDIVRNDREDASEIFLNNGSAVFSAAVGVLPADSASSYEVIHGDIDLDGDEDLYWVNFTDFDDGLLLNDGSGLFTDIAADHIPQDGVDDNQATLADLDGDGDLDVFIAAFGSGVDRLYENAALGTARFRVRTYLLEQQPDVSLGSEALDIDNDGDLDLLVGNSGARSVRLYVNHAVE